MDRTQEAGQPKKLGQGNLWWESHSGCIVYTLQGSISLSLCLVHFLMFLSRFLHSSFKRKIPRLFVYYTQ